MRPFFCALVLLAGLGAQAARAQSPDDGRWSLHGQATYIYFRKDPFPAAYTNLNGSPNSLVPDRERSWTATATAFVGLKLRPGTELYFVPEMIALLPLSELHGLAGSVQDAELEKNGTRQPIVYRSRFFLRETWGLGGGRTELEPGPMQLEKSADRRRFVLTAGNLAIIDLFDKNSFAGDPRQQFINMNFLTYSAYDFAADARGYSWGVAGEYYWDGWAIRAGRFLGPRYPNQLQLDYSPFRHYGDQIELEHDHKLRGSEGKVRLLAFRNVAAMGRFDDAVAAFEADPSKNAAACTAFNYGSSNSGAPDLCWVRRRNTKVGIGLSVEQAIGEDVGVFLRGMKTDGQSEVYSFTSTDSSLSFGAQAKGASWHRPGDTLGLGFAQNWASSAHIRYLALGGIDGFIGDGALRYAPERAIEAYYNVNLAKFFWLTFDFQRIENPAYNADRGPVTLSGVRLHAEF